MDDKLSNLLIYNSREDILQLILENITHNQSPETIKIGVLDNSLMKYQEYTVFSDEAMREQMNKNLSLIAWFSRVIEMRQNEFNSNGISKYSELKDEQLNQYPKLVLIINDVITEFKFAKEYYWAEFRECISNICINGLKYGIQVIATANCDIHEIQDNEIKDWFELIDEADYRKRLASF